MATRASAIPLILASGSATRAELLRSAGLGFTVEVPAVDETAIKEGCRADRLAATACAAMLAEAKALRVARYHPDSLVIGADQLLVCGDAWFDKPHDMEAARAQLLALREREHELVTAVCVAHGGDILWHHVDRPRLAMRAFSETFLEDYLLCCGTEVLSSVGGYRLEGLGIQLFSSIDGDFFAILGLPLLPLLDFLRHYGVLVS